MTYLEVGKVGRLVLPKAVRERYGILRGGRVALVDTGDGVLLMPQVAATPLTHLANGFPVLQPSTDALQAESGVVDGTDLTGLIASSRAERDARNLGTTEQAE